MRNAMSKISIVVWKDLLTEVRTKDLFGGMFVFAVLTIVTFNFAFDLTGVNRAPSGSGALWVAFNFAGMLGLGRSIALERDRGSLDGLLLCPVDRGTIYLGKFIGNFLFITIVEVISIPIFAALFNLNVFQPSLFLVVLLGTVGFAAIGTLLAVMAANTRSREVMLPVLMFPILLPVVIATVRATTLILTERTQDLVPWLNLLGAYDLLFLAIAYVVFDRIVEE